MSGIFKSYDVRGIYPTEVNEKKFYLIGRAFVQFTKSKEIVVGRDERLSSEKLSEAFIRGVLDEGADVVDIGLCTTPVFYFALGNYEYAAGAMITASHNPKNYNGAKLCGAGGTIYGYEDGLDKVEKLVMENKFVEIKIKGKIEKKEIFEDYKKFVLKFSAGLKQRTIVVDYGNGAEAFFSPKVLSATNLKIIGLNETVDGNFPGRGPDPSKDGALRDLSISVKKNKADIGIAFDADADRIFFVDENGSLIAADHLVAFVAEEMLKKKEGKTFAYEATCSKIIQEVIDMYGGKGVRTKVGRANIRRDYVKHRADFGGEYSGHYFLREFFSSENGLLMFFKMLHFMDSEKKKLSELIEPYQKYVRIGPINFEVHDKESVLKKIRDNFKGEKMDFLDGVSVFLKDWWFNVRLSNTEPLVRLVIEAGNEKDVEKHRKELEKIIV